MKPGGLGGPGGTPALLYVRERSGIMACRGAVLAAFAKRMIKEFIIH